MSEYLLQAQAVTKDYVAARTLLGRPSRLVQAVKGVSLSIAPGTTLALVGESGSGKSTLGRCIAGLLRPTSGRIQLAGHDVLGLAGASLMSFRRQVQTIFQDPYSSLNPRRTVGDAIMDGMVIHRMHSADERHARMLALLSRVGLQPDHARRFPHQFSGGQRQRIAIARALALEPRFIIADEAVSALDVSVKAQVLDLLADLQAEQGLTYLFISHDLGVVRHFADRVAIMAAGELVEEGECDQIFQAPTHDYTRKLISAVPRPDPSRRRLRGGSMSTTPFAHQAMRGSA
jgi:ABC-type oligopeptide transport system ATPase subunit